MALGLRTVYTGAGGEGKGEMMYMATPAVISRLFRSLLFKPEVKAALSALLGGPVGSSYGQFFTKPARTGLGTMWHQDNAYFHLPDPVDGIAMWIVRLICCPHLLPSDRSAARAGLNRAAGRRRWTTARWSPAPSTLCPAATCRTASRRACCRTAATLTKSLDSRVQRP